VSAIEPMDPYAVFELQPGCSDGEVQAAYERAKKHLGPDSLATYALVEPQEAREMLARLEEAFRLIGNPEQRRIYDQGRPSDSSARPSDHAEPAKEAPVETKESPKAAEAAAETKAEPVAETRAEPKQEEPKESPKAEAAPAKVEPVKAEAPPPAPKAEPAKTETKPDADAEPAKPVRKTEADIPPDAAVTGEALKKVREARGLTLKELEGKTKIGHWHLENIEKERFKDLPALVYLRGFLMSLARELKLDPIRVSRSYLEQMAKLTGAASKDEEK